MHRYIALHAVGPNSEVNSTSRAPQRGQAIARRAGIRVRSTGPAARLRPARSRDAVLGQGLAPVRRDVVA